VAIPQADGVAQGDAQGESADWNEEPLAGATPDVIAEARFRRGLALLREGRSSEAEAAWQAALELDPNNELARRALVGSLVRQNRRAEAERLLAEGLKRDPSELRLSMSLAQLQLGRGARAEALRTLEAGLPYAQGNAAFLAKTAELKAQTGQYREADALYRNALRLNPSNAAWHVDLAMTLRADGRDDAARTQFRRARDLDGLSPERRAFVEQQLLELGD
jgi:MSHA biogenesis protein MshN